MSKEDMEEKIKQFQLHLMITEMNLLREEDNIGCCLVNEIRREYEKFFNLDGELDIIEKVTGDK